MANNPNSTLQPSLDPASSGRWGNGRRYMGRLSTGLYRTFRFWLEMWHISGIFKYHVLSVAFWAFIRIILATAVIRQVMDKLRVKMKGRCVAFRYLRDTTWGYTKSIPWLTLEASFHKKKYLYNKDFLHIVIARFDCIWQMWKSTLVQEGTWKIKLPNPKSDIRDFRNPFRQSIDPSQYKF